MRNLKIAFLFLVASVGLAIAQPFEDQIAVTSGGTVVMVGHGLPTSWNGQTLTIINLTEAQSAALKATQNTPNSGITFDGTNFSALPASNSPVVMPPTGVSCNGTPSASFTVVSGVVTHC